MSTERPHHPFSPSTLQSLEACPCYEGTQSTTPHPRTVIGTMAHDATETGEDNLKLTDEDSALVAECIDFYEERKEAMEQRRREAAREAALASQVNATDDLRALESLMLSELPPITELKEVYLPVDDLVFPGGVQGTTAGYIDAALISHDQTYAEIADWKFGRWPVEKAANNLQGIAYALGMFHKFPLLQEVRYWFKQPLLDYITDAVIERKDVPEKYLRVQVVVAKAREARRLGDFSTAKAHVPACNFCKHIARCPVVTTFACKTGSKFFPVEIPADITPTAVHDPQDTKLGLVLADVLTVWAKAFKGVIADRVIRGDAAAPEGFKVASRTPREIADPIKYKETALRYIPEEAYNTTLKPSLGKVEKLISEAAPRGQKEARVEEFGEAAAACGAIVDGDRYTFLQAIPQKPNKAT